MAKPAKQRPGKNAPPAECELGREFTCGTCAFYAGCKPVGLKLDSVPRRPNFKMACLSTATPPDTAKYPDQGCIWWERAK